MKSDSDYKAGDEWIRSDGNPAVLTVRWRVGEIVDLARSLDLYFGRSECNQFLDRNNPEFLAKLSHFGDGRLIGALKLEFARAKDLSVLVNGEKKVNSVSDRVPLQITELPIFIEPLAGRQFERTYYCEKRFGQLYEPCEVCYSMISERNHRDAVKSGFVSVVETGDARFRRFRWDWICGGCYEKYKDQAGWSVLSSGLSAGAPKYSAGLPFDFPTGMTLLSSVPDDENPFVVTLQWSAEEICSMSQIDGPRISSAECEGFLARNALAITAKLKSVGDERLLQLLWKER